MHEIESTLQYCFYMLVFLLRGRGLRTQTPPWFSLTNANAHHYLHNLCPHVRSILFEHWFLTNMERRAVSLQ